ncbi:MAG: hypothetical protein ABI432_00340 [Flavobacteriales bacterium]
MSLFQRSVLEKYLRQQDGTGIAKDYEAFKTHFHDLVIQDCKEKMMDLPKRVTTVSVRTMEVVRGMEGIVR